MRTYQYAYAYIRIRVLYSFYAHILVRLFLGCTVHVHVLAKNQHPFQTFGTGTKLEGFVRCCIESLEHKNTNISPQNCNKMLIFGK